MPLHFKAPLCFAFPFRDTTYTRTGGFCRGANPKFQRVARQNPPVLHSTESACSCPEQPLSADCGRQRYNTLDFAGKIVCHETPGFIGCFRPRQRCRLWKPLPRERCPHWIPQPTGRSRPYWKPRTAPAETCAPCVLHGKGNPFPLETQLFSYACGAPIDKIQFSPTARKTKNLQTSSGKKMQSADFRIMLLYKRRSFM